MPTICNYNISSYEYSANHSRNSNAIANEQTRESRKNLIFDNIVSSDCKIMALQGVSEKAFNDLQGSFNELQNSCESLNYKGHYFKPDAAQSDGVAIFYNRARLVSIYTSICTTEEKAAVPSRGLYIDFQVFTGKDSLSDRYVRVANVHIEKEPKKEGDQRLKEFISFVESPYSGQPYTVDSYVICAGLNEDASSTSSRLDFLTSAGYRTDNSTSESEIGKNRRIDWICFKESVSHPSTLDPIDFRDRPVASSHHMIGTEIKLSDPFQMISIPLEVIMEDANLTSNMQR